MKDFDTEDKCKAFLMRQRWNGSPVCPFCGSDKYYIIEGGNRFKCGNNECYKRYSVTVGTVFHASKIPLTTWFPAMYLLSAHKKGISSHQLAKDLGVTQKTAWFMMHRIRKSLQDNHSDMLFGTIEVDETYMGRKFRSDFKGLPEEQITDKMKKALKNKGAVIGLAQRDGKIKVKAFNEIDGQTAKQHIKDNVEAGAKVYTDQSSMYRTGLDEYNRESVNHGLRKPEWVRGDVHVNTVESFWGMMKRGIYGIYHHISYKHLQAYCDEFAYRRNSKHLRDGERFELSLTHIEGKLPYKQLIGK